MLYPPRRRALESLLDRLDVLESWRSRVDFELLDLALTHPSLERVANYDRLEFVGDAIVRTVAAELLWDVHPDWPVGDMAAVRSILVSDVVLAELADSYNLDRYLLSSPAAAKDEAGRQSRLADALEAIAGALYLAVRTTAIVRPWLEPHFRTVALSVFADPARNNYKAALQEWTQEHYKCLPIYRVSALDLAQADLHRAFVAEVWLGCLLYTSDAADE
mgnify:CR=1 FL=1